jgi:hypothetical protein
VKINISAAISETFSSCDNGQSMLMKKNLLRDIKTDRTLKVALLIDVHCVWQDIRKWSNATASGRK